MNEFVNVCCLKITKGPERRIFFNFLECSVFRVVASMLECQYFWNDLHMDCVLGVFEDEVSAGVSSVSLIGGFAICDQVQNVSCRIQVVSMIQRLWDL